MELKTSESRSQLYSPIDKDPFQIRVLCIPPRALDEPIEIEMVTVSLKDAHNYTAISYVWGDPTITENIRVNGHIVPVTTNLADALRYISLRIKMEGHFKPLYLWADAICINQKNTPERNQQLKLMGEIYSQVDQVICWLGASDDYHGVVAALDGIGRRILEDQNAGKGRNEECFKDYPALFIPSTESNESRPSVSNTPFESGVVGLANNPYWERIWVVQELVLAKSRWILCRDEILQGDHLEAFLRWLDDPPPQSLSPEYKSIWEWVIGFSQSDIGRMKSNIYVRKQNHVLFSNSYFILPLLYNFRTKASDPRDRVYAFLSLCYGSSIPIDYAKSTRDVYIDAAEDFVLHGDPDEFLLLAGLGHGQKWDNSFGLPSWVPNWEDISGDFHSFSSPKEEEFSAGIGGKDMRQSLDLLQTSEGVLRPVCVFFDTVDFVHEFKNTEEFRMFCVKYAASESNPNSAYPGSLSRIHVLFQLVLYVIKPFFRHSEKELALRSLRSFLIFLLGVDRWIKWCSNMEGSKEAIGILFRSLGLPLDEAFEKHIRNKIISEDESGSCSREGTPQEFLFPRNPREFMDDIASLPPYLSEILIYRRFFHTGKGYLALGPQGIKATDDIIVIPGYSYPFLIRYINGQYFLVGPCYVVGIMKGEIGTMFKNGELSLKELEIY